MVILCERCTRLETPEETSKKSFWTTLPGILTGIAAIVTSIGGLATLVNAVCNAGIVCEREKVPSSESTPIVLNVDNIRTASGLFYSVIENGFSEGAISYTDRDYTFIDIPGFLVGATYIMTANEDKFSTDSEFLSFDVNLPVSVYIGYSVEYPMRPDWLLSEFRRVSGSYNMYNPDPNPNVWHTLTKELYLRDYPPGRVILGGNRNPNDSYNGGMYTVIIVKR